MALPIRAALPVLTKAHSRDDLHPSVGLLSGAALLGLRLVAAGQIEPAGTEPSWRMGPLAADDEDRVLRLAAARAHEGLTADAAEDVVRVHARRGRRRDAASGADGPATACGGPPTVRAAAARAAPALRRAAVRAAPAGADLAAGGGRRGGAGRRRRAAGAPGPRRAEPAPPLRRRGAVDRRRARARLRRPGAHPRRHRAPWGGRGVARARPAARAAGPRPDHPRRRRAGEPARARRRGARRREGSTCSGRAAWGAS